MKAYIFTDELFCWVGVAIANSEEEARAMAGDKVAGLPCEEKPLDYGWLAEGGGNG